MAFVLKYYTQTVDHGHSAWKFELYEEGAAANGTEIKLQSGFILTRGSASAKHKRNYILPTYVQFNIYDEGRNFYDLIRSKDEYEFKGVITKDGTAVFTGFVSIHLDKVEIDKTNPVVRVRVYDPIVRLKEFKATTLTFGLRKYGDIIMEMLNKFSLDLDLIHYFKITITEAYDISTDSDFLGVTYTKVEDYLVTMGNNISCYDLLMAMCKQFNWNVFQHNNKWVFRQTDTVEHVVVVLVDGILRENLTSAGVYSTSAKIDLDVALARSDLLGVPKSFRFDKIEKMVYKQSSYNQGQEPYIKELIEQLGWVNGLFKEGSNGWTTVSGSPLYREDGVIIPSAGEIKQTSGTLAASEDIIIKASSTCSRMILDLGDNIQNYYENKMMMIEYDGASNTYWWNFITQAWNTGSPTNQHIRGEVLLGFYDGSDYIERYSKVTVETEIDTAVPAESGEVIIHLYGGDSDTGNGFPFEFTAMHSYAFVYRKLIAAEQIYVAPESLKYIATTGDSKEKVEVDVPFGDYNPYSGVTFWMYNNDPPSSPYYFKPQDDYSPDSELLFEMIVKRTLKFNQETKGYVLQLKPGTTFEFIDIAEMNIESLGTSYFLPVYEKTNMIDDHRKFILLEHIKESPTISAHKEFVFQDASE